MESTVGKEIVDVIPEIVAESYFLLDNGIILKGFQVWEGKGWAEEWEALKDELGVE